MQKTHMADKTMSITDEVIVAAIDDRGFSREKVMDDSL
jgi:hypothetical protein